METNNPKCFRCDAPTERIEPGAPMKTGQRAGRLTFECTKCDCLMYPRSSIHLRPEELARLFHETYERLAPDYNYKTREVSAVPWDDVPDNNKRLMIAVAVEVLDALKVGQR